MKRVTRSSLGLSTIYWASLCPGHFTVHGECDSDPYAVSHCTYKLAGGACDDEREI